MTDRDDGNEWASDDVYVREWRGDTCVGHYRAEAEVARRYVAAVKGRNLGVWYSIDPMPSYALPTRPLPLSVEHLGQATA